MTDVRCSHPGGGVSTAPDAPASSSGAVADGAPHLRRMFGLPSLVMFGLAYLVPLTVFTTFGSVSRITEGHLPLAYLVTGIAMLFTALSYASLVRVLPLAGSAFAYASHAFGQRAGFVTGWTLLLDYILLPAINYLIIGIYLEAQIPSVPAAAWIVGSIAVVTAMNIVGVNIVRRASFVLVIAQLVFAAIFVGAALGRDGAALSLAPVWEPGIDFGRIFAGAAILCLSFLGFDAVSTLSEEARDPTRTVPRAILLTTLGGGLIFVILSYAGTTVLPDWESIIAHDSAGLEVMRPLGAVVSMLFLIAYLAGCIASAIASQASVSRILFAMGRDGVLPRRWFGQLSPRFRTPTRATLTVAALSLVTLFVSLDTLASVISFGALFAFSAVNLAVMRIFLPDAANRTPTGLVRYGLCPAIACGLTAWLWLNLSALSLAVGIAWLMAGLLYSLLKPAAPLPADQGQATSGHVANR